MTVKAIRVFLVEDQAMVLGALVALLEREDDIDVVGSATSAEEALELIANATVDVLLTDIELPGESGLGLAEKVHSALPDMRIIMLTTFGRAGYFERAMAAGASAYILKDSPASELAAAIRKVHSGGRIIDPELVAASWASPNPLTDRERQCLIECAPHVRLASEHHDHALQLRNRILARANEDRLDVERLALDDQ